jgi:hypothetical protein
MSQDALAEEPDCELMLVQPIQIEDEGREAQIASYHSARNFMISVQDDIPGHISQVDGIDIHGVLCERNEVIPAKSDYAILATGIPLVLSQDFDLQDTDSLTVKWIEGQFKYAYKGYPLSDEAETVLKARLARFSEKGLNDWATKAAKVKQEALARAEAEATKEGADETDALEDLESETPDTSDELNDVPETEILQPDDIDAAEITPSETAPTEATKLHIQTKTEIIE